MKIEQNKQRLKYLLSLNKMTIDELLSIINDGLKKIISWENIYNDEIDINHLKRIDKIFNKGLNYYLDPSTPEIRPSTSVFFRKTSFKSDLNIGSRKVVREFEDLKISLSAITKLSELHFERKLPINNINDNPKEIALSLNKYISIQFTDVKRNFLKDFINKLGEYNIFVFEFIETHNKKNKANIDGFFIQPNVIVLKRLQNSFSREIFTLAHELGHYLLNEEEIEEIDVVNSANNQSSHIENWCNTFAFNFLLGKYTEQLDLIKSFNATNDYGHDLVSKISKQTNLSRIAIFTNLLLQNKLNRTDYYKIKAELEQEWHDKENRRILAKEQAKLEGIEQRGRVPQAIQSDLFIYSLNIALNSGIINEYEFCHNLKITPKDIDNFILI